MTYERGVRRDDTGGEPPCFMCLLDEDGLLPERNDGVPPCLPAGRDESAVTHKPTVQQNSMAETLAEYKTD